MIELNMFSLYGEPLCPQLHPSPAASVLFVFSHNVFSLYSVADRWDSDGMRALCWCILYKELT